MIDCGGNIKLDWDGQGQIALILACILRWSFFVIGVENDAIEDKNTIGGSLWPVLADLGVAMS